MLSRGVSVGIALAFSLIGLNWSVPANLDSDTILQSLMSIQNLTLFYWAQDRYLNLMPFLAGWIRDPQANFIAILVATGATFFLLLEVISDTVAGICFPQQRPVARLTMLLSLILASVVVFGAVGLYNFAYAAQPYGISYLLTIVAWRLVFRKDRPSGAEWVLVTATLLIASGLNPSVLLASLAIFFAITVNRPCLKSLLAMVISTVAYFFWGRIKKATPESGAINYTDFVFDDVIGKLVSTLKIFERDTGHLVPATATLALVLVLSVSGAGCQRSKPCRIFSWVLAIFAVAWWVVFANNTWVSMNDGMTRYFFPSLMAIAVFVALRLTQLLVVRGTWIRNAALLILCGGSLVAMVRPFVPLGQYAVFSNVAQVQGYAQSRRVRLFAGNYWMAWPANQTFNAKAFRAARDSSGEAYTVAMRGSVNRAAIDEMLLYDHRHGIRTRAVCVGDPVAVCREQLTSTTSFFWDFVEAGDCSARCYLFEVASIQFRPDAPTGPDLASKISISLDAKVNPGFVYVLVSISNHSDQILSTYSSRGNLKLSWRVIPLVPESLGEPGWDARQDLLFALAPGQTRIEPLALPTPERPGRYRIEVSLVQEGVAWMHDLGMKVATATVDVSQP